MHQTDKLLTDQFKCKNKIIQVQEETRRKFCHNLGIEKYLSKFMTKSRNHKRKKWEIT